MWWIQQSGNDSSRCAPVRAVVRCVCAVLIAGGILTSAHGARADNGIGQWPADQVSPWPFIPIHALLMRDGRVLTYGAGTGIGTVLDPGEQTGRFWYDFWSPTLGIGNSRSHMTLPNTTTTDIFCGAQLMLPDKNQALLFGGDNWDASNNRTKNQPNNNSLIVNPAAGPKKILSRTAKNMKRKRWYATATMLPNGEVYIQGGKGGADRPEVRRTDGSFRLLGNVNTTKLRALSLSDARDYWYYPRNFLAPDGRVFGVAGRAMYYVNPVGKGTLSIAGTVPSDGPWGRSSNAVMYRPGEILVVGGGPVGKAGRGAAAVIDINGATPTYRAIDPLPDGVGLHWANATVVADGRVVVTGGSRTANELDGVNFAAFIWDPDGGPVNDPGRGRWTKGAASGSGKARLYHSIALLLPDAALLVGGGGGQTGPEDNYDAEIYSPPYLLTGSGTVASRPTVSNAPQEITLGKPFTLKVNRAVARVTLVRTGSVTHGFNMDQRFMELAFTAPTVTSLSITPPGSANVAPPGSYLLFVIDQSGVPSLGRIVRLKAA